MSLASDAIYRSYKKNMNYVKKHKQRKKPMKNTNLEKT